MAAPGIRIAETARELAVAGHAVTLLLPHDPELPIEHVRQVNTKSEEDISRYAAKSDVVILGGAGHHLMPLPRIPRGIPRVVDLSFPVILEVLAADSRAGAVWPPPTPPETLIRRLSRYLLESDLLLCASEQQREYYLGCLTVLGRVDRKTVTSDPTLRHLLAVVPFGCPSGQPARTGPGPRGVIRGVSQDDFVVLWSGGLGDWYDPETVVRAAATAARGVPNLRLIFIGANPDEGYLPETSASARVRRLAQELGVLDRHVFFHDQWVPYGDRANWICEADVAVVASHPTLETELAVRTRFLDYLWCAIPTLTTEGGMFAALVRAQGLGIVTGIGDSEAMSEAMASLSSSSLRAKMRERIHNIRPAYTWERMMQPLLAYCESPTRSRDLSYKGVGRRVRQAALLRVADAPHDVAGWLRGAGWHRRS